ncbi:pyruvate, phosphate dikinase [Actinomadura hibisca]|uniref:pyruvate, phosphate dikinase n=1 Tax=Actinomadura hibisca TaxID=68565 RepID=UPI0008324641|nr:pyruvate, phosphate dikinase [Actinomadura hibisca]
MRWIRPLSAQVGETAETIGAKAHGLVALHRLGLPVPAGFVVTTEACRAFLREGRLPTGLDAELTAAMRGLETATGRRFGGTQRPLAVSVRSGAGVSMPGMMNTILNLGLTTQATAGLTAETGDARFALNSRLRFLTTFASALTNTVPEADTIEAAEDLLRQRSGRTVPDDAARQLELAVEAVFSSWNTPRARTYRKLHDIPHDLGTAVIVQAMVFGNRDDRSGTGVAFSRDPNTGEKAPFGDVLFGHQGEDVVSGRSLTHPLRELADREPPIWDALTSALNRIEAHHRDACYVEFTFQAGELWLLQARPGRFVGAAAVRLATDLADERLITRDEALLRVSPHHLRHVRTPRMAAAEADVLGGGVGACPGVATGRIATTTDAAVRMAADGPVILARPETSPHDLRGLAAATGVLTTRGGPASHAAVVARAMGKPAVVGVTDLTIDAADASVRAGGRTFGEGTLITIDGTSGEVALGTPPIVTNTADAHLRRLLAWADQASGDHSHRTEAQRLSAAHAAISTSSATS